MTCSYSKGVFKLRVAIYTMEKEEEFNLVRIKLNACIMTLTLHQKI